MLYTGKVNGNGTEIAGTWHFSTHSGSFTMQRESFTAEELEAYEEVGEQV